MDFLFSTEIDPSTYETDGLCDGYPLRLHKNDLLADLGCLRAHEDWNRLVAPVKSFNGGISARYNWMSVSVPECLPDRIEIMAYANEIVFLHDDVIESVDKSKANNLTVSTLPRPTSDLLLILTDRETSSVMCSSKGSTQSLPPASNREAS